MAQIFVGILPKVAQVHFSIHSKKARKELDNQKRTVWAFSPTTKKVESKKLYNRKKNAYAWKDDFGMSVFCLV